MRMQNEQSPTLNEPSPQASESEQESVRSPPVLRAVRSSHVDGVAYDPASQELHVSFRGRRGIYKGVPADVAEAVQDAPSIGQALHLWVRGNYEFGYLAVPDGTEG